MNDGDMLDPEALRASARLQPTREVRALLLRMVEARDRCLDPVTTDLLASLAAVLAEVLEERESTGHRLSDALLDAMGVHAVEEPERPGDE